MGVATCRPGAPWGPALLLTLLHGSVGAAFGAALYFATNFSPEVGLASLQFETLSGLMLGCGGVGLCLTPAFVFLTRCVLAAREFPLAEGGGSESSLKATFGTAREAGQPTRRGLILLGQTRLLYNAWGSPEALAIPLEEIVGRTPFSSCGVLPRGIRIQLRGDREVELLVSVFQRNPWLVAIDAACGALPSPPA